MKKRKIIKFPVVTDWDVAENILKMVNMDDVSPEYLIDHFMILDWLVCRDLVQTVTDKKTREITGLKLSIQGVSMLVDIEKNRRML